VAGGWRWRISTPRGDRNYTLRLQQEFQEIKGSVSSQEGRQLSITDAKLTGDRVGFTVKYKHDEPNKQEVVMQFNGQISGDTIKGTVEIRGGSFAGNYIWTASRNP
jgi:hypothetical protein